nr:elongator complex protein 6 [Columba livia]
MATSHRRPAENAKAGGSITGDLRIDNWKGKFTLLRDTRTDGSFLVHHFLSFYLRAGCKVCFVALLQSFSHYNIVAQKLGVSLAAAKERGQLVFLEGLRSCLDLLFGEEEEQPAQPSPLQFISGSASDLRALFDFVRTSLTPSDSDSWKGPVLLVDDLSVLLGLGAAPVAVLDFIHYCRVTVCSRLQGNIVVLVHSNEDSEDEENELVVNALCHHSDLILWAEGLATGFCKDVHGQIKIIKRLSLELTGEQDQVQIYQYKIQDKNVTFFARGLSAAVL